MKIAYIIDGEFDFEMPNSVAKKVISQVKHWCDLKHDIFIYSTQSGTCFNFNEFTEVNLVKGYSDSDSALSKLVKYWRVTASISKDIKSKGFDVIYTRHLLFSLPLRRLFDCTKSVMEINSNDEVEYTKYSLFSKFYNKFGKRLLTAKVDRFVCVTNELDSYISSNSSPNQKKHVIANGIEFPSNEKCRSKLEFDSFIFVASPGNACHGLDLLLNIAEILPDYRFNIVGYEGENYDNVIYHGYLSGGDLTAVMESSSLGFSALAIERHGMKEACPLKSRLYATFGLPMVGNYIDTDLDGSQYYLQLSNSSDASLSASEIKGFLQSLEEATVSKSKIRNDYQEILNTFSKEEARLKIFREVCNEK